MANLWSFFGYVENATLTSVRLLYVSANRKLKNAILMDVVYTNRLFLVELIDSHVII